MNKKLRLPIKFGILVAAILLMNVVARAATFTAVASGNWSNTLTWGGTVPSLTNVADQIIIPIGITVTQDYDVALSGATAQITVLGTLTAMPNTILYVITGIISGSGIINSDSLDFGTSASFLFTGSVSANTWISSALSLQTAATMIVNQSITLLAGTFSVQTGGMLTLAGNSNIVIAGGTLATNGGSLALTSNYNVTYNTGTTLAGLELTGSGLHDVNVHIGAGNTLTLINNLTVNGTLTLSSGSLILAAHDLNIKGDVGIGAGTITSTSASNISIIGSNNLAGTLIFVGSASGVNNFTLAIGNANQATISGILTVHGIFMLTNGILNLSSATLNINGDIAASNTGTIAPSVNSNIAVNTLTSPVGALSFAAATNTLNNFTANIGGSGSVMIASSLTINGILTFTSGHIDISNNILTMGSTATISGASSSSYVITGTGALAIPVGAGVVAVTAYPIGTATAYLPATASLFTGTTSGTIRIGVLPHAYANGTTGTIISATQHSVDATWDVNSNIVTNLNLNLQVLWSAASEVNGFVRGSSYLAHYTAGAWDTAAVNAAGVLTGSMYVQSRTHLTSLSPFAVFDNSTTTGVMDISNMAMVEIYPNPSAENISIIGILAADGVVNMEIRNINGELMRSEVLANASNKVSIKDLPTGNYFIQLHNNKTNTVKKFIKI